MNDKLKILLCEDDENLGMLLREFLQAKGFVADLFADGDAGYKAFIKSHYDLCVLDVMMPKKDGFELARDIRNVNADVPIVFLTAKALKDDVLEGFKLGADDYITKPYTLRNVLARVRTVLRRTAGSATQSDESITFKGLTVLPHNKTCIVDGVEVKMPRKEFEILLMLLSHPGHIFTREQILSEIWPDEVVVLDRVVDVNITRIRNKIGPYGRHIVTRTGYGYGFME